MRIKVQEELRNYEPGAEAQLALEHAILEGIFENAVDAIYAKNLEGEFRMMNRAAATLFRLSPKEAIGKRSRDLLPADLVASSEASDKLVITSGDTETKEELVDLGRGPQHLLVTRSPYWGPDGRVLGVVGVAKDITEWRRAESEAVAKRAHLSRIIEFAPDAMITINARHEILAFNPAAEQIFGCQAAEILGAPMDQLLPPRYRAAHRGHLATFVASDIRARRMETRREMFGLRASGEEFPFEASIMQYTEGDQSFQSVILRDLTEQHRAEQALQLAQDEIRQAQKLETIGQLASGVAHDFNNALTVIRASAELAREALPHDSPVQLELHEINLATRHAAGLSNQLLAYARRQVLKPVSLDLNALLEEVEPMLRRAAGEQVTFEMHLSPGVGSLLADATQLKQVLVNLVVNARDAMPQGGSLTLETSVSLLHQAYGGSDAAMDPGSYVSLVVRDTGMGMDTSTLDRIFEPYFTTKGPGRGTGLGLATSYGIVKQSGGYIWAESQLGLGTTFRIHFPRIETGGQVTTEMAVVTGLASGGETLLLVDDDPQIVNVSSRVLSSVGYQVMTAPGSREALAIFLGDPGAFDAVISDVMMPYLNGIELSEQLLAIRPDLPILLVSGFAEGVVAAAGGLPEGVVLLSKPYTVEELRDAVQRLFH